MKVMKWVCQSTCDCEKITDDEYRMARAAVLEEVLNNNSYFTELYHNFCILKNIFCLYSGY